MKNLILFIWCLVFVAIFGQILTELPDAPSAANKTVTLQKQREFVKQLATGAFFAYLKSAPGHESFLPSTGEPYSPWFGSDSGLSMIAPLTTFWIMDLKSGWDIGVKWLEEQLKFDKIDQLVSVHKTVTEYVGCLLSCYALTGNSSFLDAAKAIEKTLEPAWKSKTDLPYASINPKTGAKAEPETWLTWAAGQQLEYLYLAKLTNETQYSDRVAKIRRFLQRKPQKQGPAVQYGFVDAVNVEQGIWALTPNWPNTNFLTLSLNHHSSGLYNSLLKSYIRSNRTDTEALEIYRSALEYAEKMNLFELHKPSGKIYARSYIYTNFASSYNTYTMYQSACYLGAMLSLGAGAMRKALSENRSMDSRSKLDELARIERHTQLAIGLTETCHQAAKSSKTGLPAEEFYFHDHENGTNSGNTLSKLYDKRYLLSPELAESYLVLYRTTKDQKYRKYAWDLVTAIAQHCKADAGDGFSIVSNVDQVPTLRMGYQPPEFLSATLKYLYLIFCDDNVLPLDKWVFNAAGHPFPIEGQIEEFPNKTWGGE